MKILKDTDGKVLIRGNKVLYATSKIDSNIVAENIKKGIDIMGVVGTCEGTGGSADLSSGVTFIDYDGTVVAHYSAEAFLELTTMPENPEHEGLISQGWNWTLENAQRYVSIYENLVIGQMYVTDDGTTRVYVDLKDGNLTPTVGLYVAGTVIVDWGDDTTDTLRGEGIETTIGGDAAPDEVVNSVLPRGIKSVRGINDGEHSVTFMSGEFVTVTHKYSEPGSYCITVTAESGSEFQIGGPEMTGGGDVKSRGIDDQAKSSFILCDENDPSSTIYGLSIKKIELGSGIRVLDSGSFLGLDFLESVTIPQGVEAIRQSAFANCSLIKAVTLPDTLKVLDERVFENCTYINTVSLSYGIDRISEYMFNECKSLSIITLPDSVVEISNSSPFGSCYNLSTIIIPVGVKDLYLMNIGNFANLKNVVIPADAHLSYYNNYSIINSVKLIVPDDIDIDDGFFIDSNAFQNSMIKSVDISEGVTDISSYAFENCNRLLSITMPDTVSYIHSSAFSNCNLLYDINFPNNLETVEEYAFSNSGFKDIVIPENINGNNISIGSSVFSNCERLTSVTISSSVSEIGSLCFAGCYSLRDVYLLSPEPCSIAKDAFLGCSEFMTIHIPEGSMEAYTNSDWHMFWYWIDGMEADPYYPDPFEMQAEAEE
jgi:hypothetical protein